jgi:NADH-quinone oxidoreductase subunit L
MLIPLGVLALGAVFSGMIWYNVFFGEVDKVRAWFGMPAEAHHAEAGAEHGAERDHATTGEAAADTATGHDTAGETVAATEAAGSHGTNTAAAIETAVAPQAVATPVQGALLFGPDNHVLHEAHEVPKWVKVSPFIAMLIGLALAFQFYIRRPDLPGKLAENQRPLYLFLLNKWYFDEIYDLIFVRSAKWLGGFLWKQGDGAVIDGSINGVAMGIVPFFTRLAGRAQTGYIFTYAFAMVLGIAVLITWMTLSGGSN